jgi:hypothetical protein
MRLSENDLRSGCGFLWMLQLFSRLSPTGISLFALPSLPRRIPLSLFSLSNVSLLVPPLSGWVTPCTLYGGGFSMSFAVVAVARSLLVQPPSPARSLFHAFYVHSSWGIAANDTVKFRVALPISCCYQCFLKALGEVYCLRSHFCPSCCLLHALGSTVIGISSQTNRKSVHATFFFLYSPVYIYS